MNCRFKVKVVGFFEGKWFYGISAKTNKRKIYLLWRGKICKTRWGTATLFWQPLLHKPIVWKQTPTLLSLFFALNQNSPKDYILPILLEIKAWFYFDTAIFCHSIIVEKLFIAMLEQQLIREKKHSQIQHHGQRKSNWSDSKQSSEKSSVFDCRTIGFPLNGTFCGLRNN